MQTPDLQNNQVALISMPFYIGDSLPNLAISLLKASLNEENISCDNYYFDEQSKGLIGWSLYYLLSTLAYVGEWFFAASVFENFDTPPPVDLSFRKLNTYTFSPEKFKETLVSAHDDAENILDALIGTINWGQYRVIGFSTTFFQTTASLALAKRLKAIHPDVCIIFGGGNCDGIMGLELHRQFPFVDLVIRGDGDLVLPEIIKRKLNGQSINDIEGLIYRDDDGKSIANGEKSSTIFDLDLLPFPNFDDYLKKFNIDSDVNFPVQFSRGCWWGEKNHCAFCGLNGYDLTFRSKSSGRIFDELDFLSRKYGQNNFQVVDNILKPEYFIDLLPKIISERPDWRFFFEVKANLKKHEIKLLKKANARFIQPGIESFSNEILDLMNKGCRGIQNIQLLKWCGEFGIIPNWIWLSGFPNENPAEYPRMQKILPLLLHLKPPKIHYYVRLDRFSELFEYPEKFGIKDIKPVHQYQSIYPFSEEVIHRLVNHFDFSYNDQQDPKAYTQDFLEELTFWQESYAPGTLSSININGKTIIYDNRPGKEKKKYELEGIQKEIYAYCDQSHAFQAIHKHLLSLGFEITVKDLRKSLEELATCGLIFADDNWYLSLAVQRDELVNPISSSELIRETFVEAISELSNEIIKLHI